MQQRVLPPRLSVEDPNGCRTSTSTPTSTASARSELASLKARFETATAEGRKREEELAAARQALEPRADTAVLVAALPPDPRGGDVEVRAARFQASGSTLEYDLVLTRRGGPGAAARRAAARFTVAGSPPAGARPRWRSPVALSVGAQRCCAARSLPEDFRPRQTTVVGDRPRQRALGMRVLVKAA